MTTPATENGHLLTERRDDGVFVVTLNRPDKLNALSEEMRAGLRSIVRDLRLDADVRAVVLTGAGRGFCAGADLTAPRDGAPAGVTTTEPRYGFARELQTFERPVIAAINGAAAGAGLAIALACDLRLMAAETRLHPAFVKRGLGPDWGASWTLSRLVGPSRALEIFWRGEPLDADRALALGLVNAVVPGEALLPRALELAAALAQGPPLALGLTKRAVYAALDQPLAEQALLEELLQSILRGSEDAREGARAFVEKRDPEFRGR